MRCRELAELARPGPGPRHRHAGPAASPARPQLWRAAGAEVRPAVQGLPLAARAQLARWLHCKPRAPPLSLCRQAIGLPGQAQFSPGSTELPRHLFSVLGPLCLVPQQLPTSRRIAGTWWISAWELTCQTCRAPPCWRPARPQATRVRSPAPAALCGSCACTARRCWGGATLQPPACMAPAPRQLASRHCVRAGLLRRLFLTRPLTGLWLAWWAPASAAAPRSRPRSRTPAVILSSRPRASGWRRLPPLHTTSLLWPGPPQVQSRRGHPGCAGVSSPRRRCGVSRHARVCGSPRTSRSRTLHGGGRSAPTCARSAAGTGHACPSMPGALHASRDASRSSCCPCQPIMAGALLAPVPCCRPQAA